MANPLLYDVQNYYDALSKYNRSAQHAKVLGSKYNESVTTDDQGRILVQKKDDGVIYSVEPSDGELKQASLPSATPEGGWQYTAMPDDDRFNLVRQGPNWQMARPAEFTGTAPTMPSLSNKDLENLQRGTTSQRMVAAERGGLVSEAIRGRGLL
jgi:hypothetical protein